MSLARKTLVYEWRKFAPAVCAIAGCGVLLLVLASLVAGIVNATSLHIRASYADLWIGAPGTPSVDQGRPISEMVETLVRGHPQVTRVEPLRLGFGFWSIPGSGDVAVFVTGIDTSPQALAMANILSAAQRAALNEPGAVIVDRADLAKLNIEVGDTAEIFRRRVRVVAAVTGLRALGGVNVIASASTARMIDPEMREPVYFLARLNTPELAEQVAAELQPRTMLKRFEVWTADAFAERTLLFWLLEAGAGIAVMVISLVAITVSIAVTSQTLMGAIASSLREFATLRALGVRSADLRAVILEQSMWICGTGAAIAVVLTSFIIALAFEAAAPIVPDAATIIACVLLLIGVSLLSGLLAARHLRRVDPAGLLR